VEREVARGSEAFRALFEDSVRLRLRSDVPVGTCASGGIDSSAIVSLATRAFGQQMHSFSAVYTDPGYDEGTFVDLVTRENETIAARVTPVPHRWFEILPRLTWHQDGPSSAAGLYTQWHVMELAATKVTVLLDGQGGDELFAGYFRYLPVLVRQLWQTGKLGRAAAETAALAHVWREHFAEWGLRQFLRAGIRRWRGRGGGTVDQGLLRGELASAPPLIPAVSIPAGLDPLNRVLYRDVMVESVPMLLRFEDRNSMAHHLEARVPFLDYRVVEFALSLPGEQKVAHGLTKAFLRRALEGIVPEAILARRDKKGYPTPFATWLRGPLKDDAWAFLNDVVLPRGWYDVAGLRTRWEQHQRATHDWSAEIGAWMTAELWYRQVVEGRAGGV
jgi:asparagine synthase (glutamine-hydrolysing)